MMKFIPFVGFLGLATATGPMASIGLSPSSAGSVGNLISKIEAREHSFENSAASRLTAAYNKALADARSQIASALGSSFLGAIRVKLVDAPTVSSQSLNMIESFENDRERAEAAQIDQAAAEFGAITNSVVSTLRQALGKSSFLHSRATDDVQVRAGKQSFPAVVEMLQATENHRGASEAQLFGKALDLQTQLVKAENAMIASALHK